MDARIWLQPRVRQSLRRKPRSRFHNGQRQAVRRALTGARIRLGLPVQASSLASAAQLVGSSKQYVEAATWLLQAEDPALLDDVLAGRKPLLAAAAEAHRRADLIAAFRKASAHDKAISGSTLGVNNVWDEMIVPSL